ncbi:MAG: phage minor tail protein L [Pikeienuella sp.]|uniref:phage minor tail protein L n=1 Tax=Pikeienuella sp. TaxID=2831957 RepID=UPI003918A39C
MPEAINSDARRAAEGFDLGAVVELFTLDASPVGGGVHRFAPAPVDGPSGPAAPVFDGLAYTPIPFDSTGWEWSADGPLPAPELTFRMAREDGAVSGAATTLLSLVALYDDLVGCPVTRTLTLRRFLDDGEEANGAAHFGVERYVIDQKTGQGADFISFRLATGIDHAGLQLPRRQAINRCQHRYRVPDGLGGFDYAKATCPYVGAALFDALGASTADPAEDRCGLILAHCKLRFGANAVLPFNGFPGVGRLR